MKDILKGKMIKTNRPKVDVSQVNCECLKCNWEGSIEDTKANDYGDILCPVCKDNVVIYED